MEELWKDITDYENSYQISTKGNVRSLNRYIENNGNELFVQGKLIVPANNGSDYLQVKLYNKGKAKRFYVHRLVATHFLPNNGDEVNHIDGNKMNNYVENLEWVSRQRNYTHAVQHKLIRRDSKGRFL